MPHDVWQPLCRHVHFLDIVLDDEVMVALCQVVTDGIVPQ